MAQFTDTYFSMIGRVRSQRPGVSASLVGTWLNERIRTALDMRTYWADLLTHGVLSIPNFYSTGTVNVTLGSNIVTGIATAWPVNDLVNTTVAAGIPEIGYLEVTPVSMANINVDTYLYVDAAGTPETVAVIGVTPSTFTAQFQFVHAAACTLTTSSLAGMQFRLDESSPIFTATSFQSPTQLTTDIPWGNSSVANSAYQLVKAYFTIAPDLKDVLFVLDQLQGIPLRIHVPCMEVNWRDPQRSATGPPLSVVDLAPSAGGSMQYELWPWQFGPYQLGFIYQKQWPPMVRDTDKPPWFINPTTWIYGALADAYNHKINKQDEFHDQKLAAVYEARFRGAIDDAINADESKFQRAYQFNFEQLFGAAGAMFWQSHDPDVMAWNL